MINCFKDSPQAVWLEVSRGIGKILLVELLSAEQAILSFKVECFFSTQHTTSLYSFLSLSLSSSINVVRQSAFLMNLIILAAGQETMLQLLSWRSLLKQTVKRPWIDVNSKSKRFLDALKEPHFFERSFMFGYYAPVSEHEDVK